MAPRVVAQPINVMGVANAYPNLNNDALMADRYREMLATSDGSYNPERDRSVGLTLPTKQSGQSTGIGYFPTSDYTVGAEQPSGGVSQSGGSVPKMQTQAPNSGQLQTEGGKSNGGMDMVSSVFNMVSQVQGDLRNNAAFFVNIKKMKQEQKNFDQMFNENVRQWGLEYGLKEWATRKGVELEEAKQKFYEDFQKASFDLDKMVKSEQIQTERLGRRKAEYEFGQQQKTDTNRKELAGRIAKALFSGLTGGKQVMKQPDQRPVAPQNLTLNPQGQGV